jgi:hypothetical protein
MPFFVIAAMPEGFGDDAMQLGPGAGLQRPGVPFAVHEDAAAELRNHPYLVEVDSDEPLFEDAPDEEPEDATVGEAVATPEGA